MSDITRLIIDLIRHAKPLLDPQTKHSLDELDPEGVDDAVHLGFSQYQQTEGGLYVASSDLLRAQKTGTKLILGATGEEVQPAVDPRLGLGHKDVDGYIPPTSPYGEDFIHEALENNPWLLDYIMTNIQGVFANTIINNLAGTHVNISHGPIVEIAAGYLMGAENIGELAAQPLDGLRLTIDTHDRSGKVDPIVMEYKGEVVSKNVARELIVG